MQLTLYDPICNPKRKQLPTTVLNIKIQFILFKRHN